MLYTDALTIASGLVERITPACERCEIAGGVRRKKAEPHDIEIVMMPKAGAPRAVFGQKVVHKSQLELVLWEMEQERILSTVKGGEKLKVFKVNPNRFGIPTIGYEQLDLFIVTPPAQWGPLFTIRTGPAEFSHWLVTPSSRGGRMPDGYVCKDGSVYPGFRVSKTEVKITGDALPMPEELDFLKFLGVGWIEPEKREAKWSSQRTLSRNHG